MKFSEAFDLLTEAFFEHRNFMCTNGDVDIFLTTESCPDCSVNLYMVVSCGDVFANYKLYVANFNPYLDYRPQFTEENARDKFLYENYLFDKFDWKIKDNPIKS